MSEVLANAKNLVDEIYKNMTKVETCGTISEQVAGMQVVFVKPGGDRYIKLDGVMSEEQQQIIKEYILKVIDRNKMDAEKFLAGLTRKAGTINQDFEDNVNCMIVESEVQKDPESDLETDSEADQPGVPEETQEESEEEQDYPELTVEYIQEHYVKDPNASISSIAAELGLSKSKVYNFLRENHIPRKNPGGASRRSTLV